jgi:hypothetical protein
MSHKLVQNFVTKNSNKQYNIILKMRKMWANVETFESAVRHTLQLELEFDLMK